jgi:hypothetical protein
MTQTHDDSEGSDLLPVGGGLTDVALVVVQVVDSKSWIR